MNSIYKNIIGVIVIVVATIILYRLFFDKTSVVGTTTTITPITEIIDNTQPTQIDTLYIKGDLKYIKGGTEYIKGDIEYVDSSTVGSIPVKKYTYIDSLANGILRSEIVADNIYNRKIELTTYKIETKETIVKSLLFLTAEIESYKGYDLRGVSVGLDYINKDKFKIGFDVGYDLVINKPYAGLSFGIPLN